MSHINKRVDNDMDNLKNTITTEQVKRYFNHFSKVEQELLSNRYGVGTDPKTIGEIAELQNFDMEATKSLLIKAEKKLLHLIRNNTP